RARRRRRRQPDPHARGGDVLQARGGQIALVEVAAVDVVARLPTAPAVPPAPPAADAGAPRLVRTGKVRWLFLNVLGLLSVLPDKRGRLWGNVRPLHGRRYRRRGRVGGLRLTQPRGRRIEQLVDVEALDLQVPGDGARVVALGDQQRHR